MRLFFLFLSLSICFHTRSQTLDAQSIEKNWLNELHQKKLNSFIKLSIIDVRKYQQNKVELKNLMTFVSEGLINKGFNIIDDINDTLKNILPVQIKLNVEYLNYTESTSKNLFVKGIIEIILEKGDFLSENKTIQVADDIFISDLSLKSLYNPNNLAAKTAYESKLLTSLANDIIHEFSIILDSQSPRIYEIISFGKAMILKNDIQKAKNDAIANALLNASTKAFGKKIQSETTMVDMGNVTEIIKESINCTVIDYKLLDGFEKSSKDKFVCVLVKSILKL